MKKRKVLASRFEQKKEPRIHHLDPGGKFDLPEPEILNTIHHLNLRAKGKSDPNLSQVEKADIIHHLDLEGKDKSDPNLSEAEKADATHHLIPGGIDQNDTRLKTPAATPINELEKPCFKDHHIYGMFCANIALDYFNKKNDTKFELVVDKPIECSPLFGVYDIWIICGFNAKEESSIKVFFAQLSYVYHLGLDVAICKVLEGDNVDIRNLFVEDKNSAVLGLYPDTPDFTPLSPYFDEDAFRELRCLKNTRIAKSALNHYNKENRASYKLVLADAIENHPFCRTSGNWFHCCFKAVDRSIQQDNAAINHLFFAEVKYSYPSGPVVYSCEKLTEGKTTRDCEDCYSDIEHPASEDGKYHGRRDKHPKNERPCTTIAHPYDYWDYFGKYKDPRKATPINGPGAHCSRDLRIFGIVFANYVLDSYNSPNNSHYELVEDGSLDSKPFTCSSGISINCSFIASQNFSIEKFSAKLEYAYSSGLTCEVSKIPVQSIYQSTQGE